MDLNEYERLKKEREEEHRKDIEALERVYRMTQQAQEAAHVGNGKRATGPAAPEARPTTAPRTGKGESGPKKKPNLTAIVKAMLVASPPESVTVPSVIEMLAKEGRTAQRSSVKRIVRELASEDFLVLVEAGFGPAPNVFKVNPKQTS